MTVLATALSVMAADALHWPLVCRCSACEKGRRQMPYPQNGTLSLPRPGPSEANGWFNYTCAHCSTKVAGAVVSLWDETRWLMCPNCGEGSVRTNARIVYPSVPFGPHVDALPPGVAQAYTEARACMSAGAFTAAELICRKILMHVSVEKGADKGLSFAAYLTHLEEKGVVTAPMKGWVDLIRQHGNQSAHELPAPDQARAESTVMFTAELLRLTYEMSALAKKYAPPAPTA